MIWKLLMIVTTTLVMRSKISSGTSTPKPTIPRDLQELLDSLYNTGYIPEYILPEDELSETEKTEGEYLDIPELKNAQDDVFVPPESEYSKNSLHYKNIKPRKRLITDKHMKIKLMPRLQREIRQHEESREELSQVKNMAGNLVNHIKGHNTTGNLVNNVTKGVDQHSNSSVKLDFLIPIPERGVYPSNNLPNEGWSSTEYSSTENVGTNEKYNTIQNTYNSTRPIQHYTTKSPEYFNSKPNELNNPTEGSNVATKSAKFGNPRLNESSNTVSFEGSNTATDECIPVTINPGNSISNELNNPRPTEGYNPATNDNSLPKSTKPANNQSTTDNCLPSPGLSTNRSEGSQMNESCNTAQPYEGFNTATDSCIPVTTKSGSSRSTELNNTGPTEGYNLATTDDSAPKSTKPANNQSTTDNCLPSSGLSTNRSDGSKLNESCNTAQPYEGFNTATDYCIPVSNKSSSSRTTEVGNAGQNDQMNNKNLTSQKAIEMSNMQVFMEFPNLKLSNNTPTKQDSMKMPNSQWPMNVSNSPLLLEILNPQKPTSTTRTTKMPNPLGLMSASIPELPLNILNPSQWFMNMSMSIKKETTTMQNLFTSSERVNIPKYPQLKSNTTMHQPLTFEVVSPKTEKNVKMFQFTAAMQPQQKVTIKPSLEQHVKNMLNIQLWTKQMIPQFVVNTKQPEGGLKSPVGNIQREKNTLFTTLKPKINKIIHVVEQGTVKAELKNSSRKINNKAIDKNIATNVASLMSDPSSISRMEVEGAKAAIKPSISLNNEITRNVETYFDRESNNSSGIKSQNGQNKERKYISQNSASNSTGKENVDNGKPKKKMFTFLNIFKKNKKTPPDTKGQNFTAQIKREINENSPNELYRLLMENNVMTDDDDDEEIQYPIEQELEEEETFNHKRKEK